MNVEKQARKDAREYARAQMYYGEGAGTRRKLISATVDSRAHKDSTYARVFHSELERQDMADHAKKAQVERVRTDRNEVINRNVRGVLTGKSQSVNTSVLLISTAVVIAHKTGIDKKIYDKARVVVLDLRARYNRRSKTNRRRHMHVVHNITNL